MKIRQVGAEWTDGQTDMTKLTVVFSNFSNVSKTVPPSTFSMSTRHLAPIDTRVCIIHLQAHICFEIHLSQSQ